MNEDKKVEDESDVQEESIDEKDYSELNDATLHAIGFAFNKFDESEIIAVTKYAKPDIKFYKLRKEARWKPASILCMGIPTVPIALLFAYHEFDVQIVSNNENVEKIMRLTKNALGLNSINLRLYKDFESVDKLNINTIIFCNSIIHYKDAISMMIDVVTDNKGRMIIANSEFPVVDFGTKITQSFFNKIAGNATILYSNEGNLILSYE